MKFLRLIVPAAIVTGSLFTASSVFAQAKPADKPADKPAAKTTKSAKHTSKKSHSSKSTKTSKSSKSAAPKPEAHK